jgi:hypothetical protein
MGGFLRALFPGDGEMAGRMRAFDWTTTELGAPARWPESLRVAAGACLTSTESKDRPFSVAKKRERYFTLVCSPATNRSRADDGAQGARCRSSETSGQVVGARRFETLHRLSLLALAGEGASFHFILPVEG